MSRLRAVLAIAFVFALTIAPPIAQHSHFPNGGG